jgi:class 3 adenylate cyclase
MSETRKIAAILVADIVGYSRLAGADEDRTLSRLRGLRSDLTRLMQRFDEFAHGCAGFG